MCVKFFYSVLESVLLGGFIGTRFSPATFHSNPSFSSYYEKRLTTNINFGYKFVCYVNPRVETNLTRPGGFTDEKILVVVIEKLEVPDGIPRTCPICKIQLNCRHCVPFHWFTQVLAYLAYYQQVSFHKTNAKTTRFDWSFFHFCGVLHKINAKNPQNICKKGSIP